MYPILRDASLRDAPQDEVVFCFDLNFVALAKTPRLTACGGRPERFLLCLFAPARLLAPQARSVPSSHPADHQLASGSIVRHRHSRLPSVAIFHGCGRVCFITPLAYLLRAGAMSRWWSQFLPPASQDVCGRNGLPIGRRSSRARTIDAALPCSAAKLRAMPATGFHGLSYGGA